MTQNKIQKKLSFENLDFRRQYNVYFSGIYAIGNSAINYIKENYFSENMEVYIKFLLKNLIRKLRNGYQQIRFQGI